MCIMLQDLSLSSFKVSFTIGWELAHPPTSLHSCRPLSPWNSGKQEGKYTTLSPKWLWLPQGRWAGRDGLSALTEQWSWQVRELPHWPDFSPSSTVRLGLTCQAWVSLAGQSWGFLPTVTGVHVYTSTFSAHVIFNPTRPFFMLSNQGHQVATALYPLSN